MNKCYVCFTVILASALMLIAACEKPKRQGQSARRLDPQNANSNDTNTADTVAAQSNKYGETEIEEEHDCHEPDCSPVAGEGVILLIDDECRLHAVDATTKKQLWKIKLKEDNGVFTSPVVMDSALYLIEGCALLSGADIKTGKLRWTFTP